MTAAYLRSWFERVERSRDERKAITDHERGLFTEAKSNGFDGKALRKVLQRRAMGDDALAEQDALVDAYEAALGGKALAAELIKGGASVRQAAEKAGVKPTTAHRSKNLISGTSNSHAGVSALVPQPEAGALSPPTPACEPDAETDRAATSSAPEGPAVRERPQDAPPDPDYHYLAENVGRHTARMLDTIAERPVSPEVTSIAIQTARLVDEGRISEAAAVVAVAKAATDDGLTIPAALDRRRA